MGFFIPDCQKMVYKMEYRPSELVCPETYNWEYLDAVFPKIAKGEYARLSSPETKLIEPMKFTELELDSYMKETIILDKEGIISVEDINPKWTVILRDIIQKIGKDVFSHFVITS
eukprot:TRINITY_DN10300_c0_g1_i4.p2 TRINITY_DN10300_c0_g1~~TRINITY_DN10300_c0_g1_i4.p2  ORF type:complete len:115 (-),score=22.38 TRINITY_DN10300_c0_g1_i4:106-450(-)